MSEKRTTRMIHVSDLHINLAEKDYALTVLAQVCRLACEKEADILLVSGDLFDSFADLEKTYREVTSLINTAIPKSCEVLFLPGNHDLLRRDRMRQGRHDITTFDFTPLRVITTPQSAVIKGVEFFFIPFNREQDVTVSSFSPAAKQFPRVLLGHGIIPGMFYTGPSGLNALEGDESDDPIVDPHLFGELGIDYAALGHIHSSHLVQRDRTVCVYPGSTRVYRKGEEGARTLAYVELTITGECAVSFVPLPAAGVFRRYLVPFDATGADLETIAHDWKKEDWVLLELSGMVEAERAVAAAEARIQRSYGSVVRRLKFNREGVLILAGITGQPLVKHYLRVWEKKKPLGTGETRVWLKARELALLKLKEKLEI